MYAKKERIPCYVVQKKPVKLFFQNRLPDLVVRKSINVEQVEKRN